MLDEFFSPDSVAIIGASREEGKVGHEVVDNILDSGFRGNVYPVNPKADEIHGLKCYADVGDLPETPSLAIVVVPSKLVPQAVAACGQKGTKAAIVISAGFKEAGIEGHRLEQQLVEAAQQYGLRVIGPNCLGLIDTATPINASFAKNMPAQGDIAFISQSGALCTAILDWAQDEGIGFSKFVSFGNKADVTETDLIQYFAEDPKTKVIAAYLEGVTDGAEFMRVVSAATKKKPVILYKSGGTTAGAKAVSSHTGTLAGSEKAYECAFYQAGAIRASTTQSLFSFAVGLAYQPLPKGPQIAIITNAGGPGIITADACERAGLPLADLSPETVAYLRENLPSAANVFNPVDVLGDALADRYRLAIEAVLKDESVHALALILTPQAMTQPEETARHLIELTAPSGKPAVAIFMGKHDIRQAVELLVKKKIPNYTFPEPAVETLAAMVTYRKYRQRERVLPERFPMDVARIDDMLAKSRAAGIRQLGEFDSRGVIQACGIRTPETRLGTSSEGARRLAQEIGYPVVAKIASPDILHKSDAGGVKVGIEDEPQLIDAYEEILSNARRFVPTARIWGAIIQEMLPPSRELIVGVNRDPQFGHLLMVGFGGIYVEVMKDVAFRIAPITREDAYEMLTELKSYRLLQGVRGEKQADIEALVDVLLKTSQLVTEHPYIVEMDINPLKVYELSGGCIAADARMVID